MSLAESSVTEQDRQFQLIEDSDSPAPGSLGCHLVTDRAALLAIIRFLFKISIVPILDDRNSTRRTGRNEYRPPPSQLLIALKIGQTHSEM
jgi:hypothetical protein